MREFLHEITDHKVILILVIMIQQFACSAENSQKSCAYNSDCQVNEQCVDQICTPIECNGECMCVDDRDCESNQRCDTARGICYPLECVSNQNCAFGERCDAGRCVTDVDSDRDLDGVPDVEDLCPNIKDAEQEDYDGDQLGGLINQAPVGVGLQVAVGGVVASSAPGGAHHVHAVVVVKTHDVLF